MLYTYIDHLVVTAPSLSVGEEYVYDILGVPLHIGGVHPLMGTHNRLLKLGKTSYLEVIAINPEAEKPDRPRWFDMDNVGKNANPRLATWVARTNDIRSAASVSPHSVGNIEPMNRGNLQWLISIPADGSLPFEGIAPTLIEWTSETHPASSLADDGCSLVRL